MIFKWGERGSYFQSSTEPTIDTLPQWCERCGSGYRIRAYQVDVKDTTGCGDSYCGGFIAGLVRGMDVLESCRLGTATSALVATGLGSDAGVVDLESTLHFMETSKLVFEQ